MTTAHPTPGTRVEALRLSVPVTGISLGLTAFFALLVYYFVGIDQGAVSVFGEDTHIHELLHDARHLLGYPCH